jgi:hypothetical protein
MHATPGTLYARTDEESGSEGGDVIHEFPDVALEVADARAHRQKHLLRRPAQPAPDQGLLPSFERSCAWSGTQLVLTHEQGGGAAE